jgi:rRNA maturation endonuclease Nob1
MKSLSSVKKSKEFYEMEKRLKRARQELKKVHGDVEGVSFTDEEVMFLERELEAIRAIFRLLGAVLKGGYASVGVVDAELFAIEERRQWGDECLDCGDAWPSDGSHDCSCISR